MTRIVQLQAENIKKLKAVRIPIGDGLTIIGGNNGEGKSSTIDALEMALAGKKSIPPRPIRDGQESARVVVELNDMVVTRRFTKTDSYLEVTSKNGAKFPSPQAMLDALYSNLSFDPVAFAHYKPAEQADTLERLAGIDTKALDSERAGVFAERTMVNRDIKTAEATVRGMPHHPDAPDKPVNIVDALAASQEIGQKLSRLQATEDVANRKVAAVQSMRAEIERVEKHLQSLRADYEIECKKMNELLDATSTAAATREELQRELGTLKATIAGSETINQKVRENQVRAKAVEQLTAAQEQSDALTARIDEIDTRKAKLLAEAKYPIDGLAITPERMVTYKGVPFEQASSAEQIRVSAAMALALNPKLRLLLIRDGSLLDPKAMAMLDEFAREHDAQVIIERVGKNDPTAVIIEDGEVLSTP